MKNNLLLIIVGMLLSMPTMAADKSDNSKPKWIHSLPEPTNSSFIYVTETAVAPTLNEARQECFSSLLQGAGFEKGVSVQSDYKTKEMEHSVVVNGKANDVTESHFVVNSTVKGKEVELQGIKIDEYWECRNDGKYYLTTLYARSQTDGKPHFDNLDLTTKYGVHGLWRSAIVPGWGQFYKGSSLKGGLILGGSVALIGGIIYTETVRKDYMNKIKKTHNTDHIRTYKTRADNFAAGRNICIGGLAALYVYNIVDAVVAPGARRIVVKKNVNGRSYALIPSFTFDGSPAICAQVTF
ncbi:MAG: hypothetical protein K2G90_00315 [Muribaculaceae bacterium]|nr:hypothetical protein [Muribaculaceae bacterium]